MKNKILKQGSFLLLSSSLLISCNSDIDVDVSDIIVDSVKTELVENITANESAIEYSVPTPNELFDIIRSQGVSLNIDLINDLSNKDTYVDTKSKAINFGVYSADIGYMSCFEHNLEFIKYSKVIEELGADLGISEVFDGELMTRIESNEGNSDSLFVISNDTYYNSYQHLEENNKGTELALIISGGFIESLYIISNLAGDYSDDNAIIEKIGGQKIVLENIIDFCSTYMDEESVSEIMIDLDELGQVYEANMDFIEESSSITTENDIVTLNGGGHFVMNEQAFTAVKEKIIEIRTKLTQK
jgi:hypothetical protein